MPKTDDAMINQINENLFEVFWSTYGKKINLNKGNIFIKIIASKGNSF